MLPDAAVFLLPLISVTTAYDILSMKVTLCVETTHIPPLIKFILKIFFAAAAVFFFPIWWVNVQSKLLVGLKLLLCTVYFMFVVKTGKKIKKSFNKKIYKHQF